MSFQVLMLHAILLNTNVRVILLFVIMLNVILLNVILLKVIMLVVILQNAFQLKVLHSLMPDVILLFIIHAE